MKYVVKAFTLIMGAYLAFNGRGDAAMAMLAALYVMFYIDVTEDAKQAN